MIGRKERDQASMREPVVNWLRSFGDPLRHAKSAGQWIAALPATDAMAIQNVHIGRSWPVWPTYVRITVGTQPEMQEFQTALHKVMSNAVTAKVGTMVRGRKRTRDGIAFPV